MTPNRKPENRQPRHTGSCRKAAILLFLLLLGGRSEARRPDFVDGYHGGIYGHYPVAWKTGFINRMLESHPEWSICLEIEPETWDSVARHTPKDYARFQEFATSPRVEFTNPTYAQPYCYNISGESLIRQFTYGIKKLKEHFPQVELTTYATEEPCFTSCLPQILKLLGYRYASLKCPNTCWGGYTAPYGGETVKWIAPDGSSIITSPRYACEKLLEGSVWQTTAWGNQPEYLEACRQAGIEHPVGMCFQDAGWKNGPWLGSGERIRANSRYVTWRNYFESNDLAPTETEYRFSQEDVRPALMWGSQVLQRIAQQVRHAENRLPAVEKMAVIAAWTEGFDLPQAPMDEAWRNLMLAQHHDSWIVPYNRLRGTATWAEEVARWTATADSLCRGLLGQIEESMGEEPDPTASRLSLRICNTLGHARKETVDIPLPAAWEDTGVEVRDASGRRVESFCAGHRLFLTAEVPAFGFSTYELKRGNGRNRNHNHAETENESEEEKYTLENERYRIVVDPLRGGVIRRLTVKEPTGEVEYVDTASGYGFGELRGHFYNQGGFRSSTEAPARVSKGRCGEFESYLLIEGQIASHPFTQRITLRKDAPEIDFELTIDWQHDDGIGEFDQKDAYSNNRRACYDDRYKLNLYFPARLADPHLDKDAPFDVCRSRLEETHYKSWDSIKHQIILNWVDLAEEGREGKGLALLSDHTTTYCFGRNEPLALTVQYAGQGLWGCHYPLQGPTRIRCALVPHTGSWDRARIDRISACRNEPLLCSLHAKAEMTACSLLDLGDSGYELTAAYPTDKGVIVRLFNAAGDGRAQRIHFGKCFDRIDKIDLNGNTTASCRITKERQGCSIECAMPRFGLTTLLIYDKQ